MLAKINRDSRLVESARLFATAAHAATGQTRKNSTKPYIVHPEAVAELLRKLNFSKVMQAAALLHDVVEDTAVTHALVEKEFGAEVSDLVRMATNVSSSKDGNRVRRKIMDIEHKAKASRDGQSLILADALCNLRDLSDLPADFQRVYLDEKRVLIKRLDKADARLIRMAISAAK